MARIATMATYPAREKTALSAIVSIAAQVETLHVTLNGYASIPTDYRSVRNARYTIPERDLMDVGKFAYTLDPDDDVFLCDDDIIYPPGYTSHLLQARARVGDPRAIVGVHGVIYSDFYDGKAGRLVHVFHRQLDRLEQVNQLGTGTICVKAAHVPPLSYMEGSGGFVDIRFARYAHEQGHPLWCVPRSAGWLREVENRETLYLRVTRNLPPEAIREIHQFGGLARIAGGRDRGTADVDGLTR